LQLDGQLLADGGTSPGDIRGGGAGGGIYVAVGRLAAAAASTPPGELGQAPLRTPVAVAVAVGSRSTPGHGGVRHGLGHGLRRRGLSGWHGAAGTVYLRDPGAASGTLVINAGTYGGNSTPLGLPGQASFTIPDTVVIRGSSTMSSPTILAWL